MEINRANVDRRTKARAKEKLQKAVDDAKKKVKAKVNEIKKNIRKYKTILAKNERMLKQTDQSNLTDDL